MNMHHEFGKMAVGLLLSASLLLTGFFSYTQEKSVFYLTINKAWAETDSISEHSDLSQLSHLDDEGRLTVRALMAWDALPEKYKPLIFEMRKKRIDLLGADASTILSWLRHDSLHHEFTPDERMLLRDLASFMVGRDYLQQFRSEHSKQIMEDSVGQSVQTTEKPPVYYPTTQENGTATVAGNVFELVAKSTVVVNSHGRDNDPIGQGSGVILSKQVVVTNCHTIENARTIMVDYEDTSYQAKVLHSDWDRDVCSLDVQDLKGPAVQTGTTDSLRIGHRVYAVGAPMGLDLTLSEGIVSSLRTIEGNRYIQTTAPISPGSSGGGLYDENGKLVGLTTFLIRDSQNLNFALPVEWIHELPDRHSARHSGLIEHGEWIEQAIDLESDEDWSGLTDHSLRWVRSEPDNAFAWFCLGIGYSGLKDWMRAVEVFRRAVRIDADFDVFWVNLGISYGMVDEPALAVDAFEQALRINPNDEMIWYYMGLAYLDMNKAKMAAKALQEALKIDPKCPYNWYYLGAAFYFMGQAGKVSEIYIQIRTLDTDIAERFFQKYILP